MKTSLKLAVVTLVTLSLSSMAIGDAMAAKRGGSKGRSMSSSRSRGGSASRSKGPSRSSYQGSRTRTNYRSNSSKTNNYKRSNYKRNTTKAGKGGLNGRKINTRQGLADRRVNARQAKPRPLNPGFPKPSEGTIRPKPRVPGQGITRPQPRPLNPGFPKPSQGTIRPKPSVPGQGITRPQPRPLNPGFPKPSQGTIRPKPQLPGQGGITRPRPLPPIATPTLPGAPKPRPVPPITRPGVPPIVKPGQPGFPKPRPVPPIVKPQPKPFPPITNPKPLPPIVKPNPPIVRPRPPICRPRPDWCGPRPPRCHWWYDWYPTVRFCAPAECITYSVDVVTAQEMKWYLGLSGMAIPGQGFGVESVEADSPAEEAGLAAGMVITSVNGLAVSDAASMASAIESAVDGLLELTVVVEGGTEAVPATVQMIQVPVASF